MPAQGGRESHEWRAVDHCIKSQCASLTSAVSSRPKEMLKRVRPQPFPPAARCRAGCCRVSSRLFTWCSGCGGHTERHTALLRENQHAGVVDGRMVGRERRWARDETRARS